MPGAADHRDAHRQRGAAHASGDNRLDRPHRQCSGEQPASERGHRCAPGPASAVRCRRSPLRPGSRQGRSSARLTWTASTLLCTWPAPRSPLAAGRQARKQEIRDSRIGIDDARSRARWRQRASRYCCRAQPSAGTAIPATAWSTSPRRAAPASSRRSCGTGRRQRSRLSRRGRGSRPCAPASCCRPSGGMLPQMLLPFRLGLGAKFGAGGQYISWIELSRPHQGAAVPA